MRKYIVILITLVLCFFTLACKNKENDDDKDKPVGGNNDEYYQSLLDEFIPDVIEDNINNGNVSETGTVYLDLGNSGSKTRATGEDIKTSNLYKDESYLTHTLPVTKNDLYNSNIIWWLLYSLL